MTRRLSLELRATSALVGFLADDAPGVRDVFDAIDKLLVDPGPADAFAWTRNMYRLRVGRYRIVYEVSDDLIYIRYVARLRTR